VDTDRLTYDQLAAYVDGVADDVDRELVESHIESCTPCRDELENLRTLKGRMESYAQDDYSRARPSRSWRGLGALLRSPVYRLALQATVVVVIGLICSLVATLPLRSELAELRAQLLRVQETNDIVREQTSALAELQSQVRQLQDSQVQQLTTSSPRVATALHDGGQLVSMDRDGNLTGVDSLPPGLQQTIKNALATERMEVSNDVAELIAKSGITMGHNSPGIMFELLGPVATVVQTERPTFRWSPLSGAAHYIVNIYDANYNQVATSPRLTGTEWTVSSSLERGLVYSWQVTALRGGDEIKSPRSPAGEARFKVLAQDRAARLEHLRQASGKMHLAAGVFYAHNGLLDDSERELKALVAANPKSPVARKLLRQIQRLRRR
jgi:anti-sigma factor RsiW